MGAVRLPLRLSDLVVVFAAIDAGMSFLLLQTAGQVVLGLAVAAGAVIALLVYVALPARGARTGALLALVAVTMLLPQALLIHSRGPGSAVNDAVLVTDAAADRLLHGLDPYGHDYIDSAMRSFYMPEVPVSFSLGHY